MAFALASDDGRVVCEDCRVAASPLARMRGLLGRSALREDEGLLLRPAGSIHTWFMRFAIDAVFLDRDDVVLKAVSNLRPWRFARARGSRAVLELPAGTCERRAIVPGTRLRMSGSEPAPPRGR